MDFVTDQAVRFIESLGRIQSFDALAGVTTKIQAIVEARRHLLIHA